jgi:hypothetical protein
MAEGLEKQDHSKEVHLKEIQGPATLAGKAERVRVGTQQREWE